jgi:DnaK suppressor protein
VAAKKPTAKKKVAKKAAPKKATAKKTMSKKKVVKKTAKKVVKQTTTKKKPVAKKKAVKKAVPKRAAKKTATKKKPIKKVASKKKVAAKKPVKKALPKKAATKKKPIAKKTVTKKKAVVTTKPVKKVAPKKVATKKTVKKSVSKTKPTIDEQHHALQLAQGSLSSPTIIAQERVAQAGAELPKRIIHDPEVGKMPDHDTEEAIDDDYMNSTELEYFRQRLIDWKVELMKEVDNTVDHLQTEDVTGVADPVDRASLETDFSLELRTRDRERKLIRKIDLALDLIKHGDYGYCEDCGVAIGRKRLEARPTAMKCIDCKTFSEIREKQGN